MVNNLIADINNERRIEAKCIQFRKDVKPIINEMKILYDTGIEEGFNDYQATIFTNTYFSAILSNGINVR